LLLLVVVVVGLLVVVVVSVNEREREGERERQTEMVDCYEGVNGGRMGVCVLMTALFYSHYRVLTANETINQYIHHVRARRTN
jgi:hypothetical protein